MDAKIRVWNTENGRNTNVIFPPVIKNKFQPEFSMVITPSHQTSGSELLWIGNEGEVLAFDLGNGKMLKRVGVPKSEVRDGVGRITGLVKRGGDGNGELYTSHALRDGKKFEGREGVTRWKARWLWKEDEDEVEEERTEKQRRLQDIFEKATRDPVRFS